MLGIGFGPAWLPLASALALISMGLVSEVAEKGDRLFDAAGFQQQFATLDALWMARLNCQPACSRQRQRRHSGRMEIPYQT